jgi:acetylglutamate kinase
MKKTSRILIKLGGSALDTELTIATLRQAIARHRSLGNEVIVVHGGGPAINHELRSRGITWSFVAGQRVTTPEMIEVIESTLNGLVNRRLVRQLSTAKLPVIGLSGTDRQTLLCSKASDELGLVGTVEAVQADWINEILALKDTPVPVIAPLGVGANGECYNINADWAATYLAVALKVDQLQFLTDQPGVLDEEGACIPSVDIEGIENMIAVKVVSGGMLTKTQAVVHALKQGVATVRILKASDALQAVENMELGTQCCLDSAALALNLQSQLTDQLTDQQRNQEGQYATV